MKLTRCYIENFGTLHQFEMSFQQGVTVIKAPNGFGKTTFAAFIRAMLYGFPRGNKSSLEKDHRRKYSPWQGGRFGGFLEFELSGKCYRVERFFGDKPAQDSFSLYELPEMRKSKGFSENLGVEIFGLDAESFERSAYMSRLSETGALSTDSIQAKLSNLVEDTGDINNYEKAVASLRKARINLLPYRGTGGEVFRASEKITAMQAELSRCAAAKERLAEIYDEIAELEQRIRSTNAEMNALQHDLLAVSEQSAAEAILRERDGLVRRREEIRAELNTLAALYPAGIPSAEELAEISTAMDRLAAMGESDGGRAAELLKKNEAKAEEMASPKTSAVLTVFLTLASLFATAGIVLFAMAHYALGGVLFGLGLLSATAGLYFHYRRLADAVEERENNTEANRLDDDVEALLREYAKISEDSESEKMECERRIKEFFDGYGIGQSLRDRNGLMLLRDDALRFKELSKRFDAEEKELCVFDALHPDIKENCAFIKADGAALRESIETLGRTLPELNRSLAEKRREAVELQEQAQRIPETEGALEHWKRVKNRGIKKAEELDKTMEYLRMAKESLSAGYMHRIESGFAHYMNCLEENEEGRIFVDTDLSVRLERGGKVRTLDYFSAGFSDVVMLCMRLALVDALFEGEKPFVIMDDPLVNLDDEHTKKALELINKLGGECQVIYLVCNSSRC